MRETNYRCMQVFSMNLGETKFVEKIRNDDGPQRLKCAMQKKPVHKWKGLEKN